MQISPHFFFVRVLKFPETFSLLNNQAVGTSPLPCWFPFPCFSRSWTTKTGTTEGTSQKERKRTGRSTGACEGRLEGDNNLFFESDTPVRLLDEPELCPAALKDRHTASRSGSRRVRVAVQKALNLERPF